ncbi:MAG: cell division ATP-binding protein FtsE [Candidatus Magasanikbacteria bacterium]
MINLKEVTKEYPDGNIGVKDVSLNIDPGEFVSIVGPSGTGKTTLVKLLIAEERPTKGKIEIGGWDITNIPQRHVPQLRRQIGVVFQDFKLLPKKTAYENVAFALQVAGEKPSEIEEIVPRVLDIVGLSDQMDEYPSEMSTGQQQRVVIARSLVHKPKILVADEPTGNLDTLNTYEITEILEKINQFGTTIVLVTHDKEVVNRLKKRVITLEDGRVKSDIAQGKYRL